MQLVHQWLQTHQPQPPLPAPLQLLLPAEHLPPLEQPGALPPPTAQQQQLPPPPPQPLPPLGPLLQAPAPPLLQAPAPPLPEENSHFIDVVNCHSSWRWLVAIDYDGIQVLTLNPKP